MNRPVTKWYHFYPDTEKVKAHWEFNHLENGHGHGEKPKPHCEEQKGWLDATWIKHETYIMPEGVVLDEISK